MLCEYVVDARKCGVGGWNRWLSMKTTIGCAWMLDGATKDRVYTLSLVSRFLSRRNRFEGYRVDSLGLNTSKSSNFITSEPIRNRFEVLSNVFIRICRRNRVDSGYSGIDSIPTEIEKHVSTILERRDMIDDVKDRLRSGPDDWSSGKYERWSSSASSGSVGLGYDNRPGELTVACRDRHASCAFV
ncbi:hypothetical protein PIB30_070838 [Stylosanthes scabra]|uniref:Uncharacterized protein n=1 Tax=Stylosanthes scabra TaxID=79078 RepID=A0ABU6QPP5_9FABA|nr:hypothetical protein [Stylosanthes scabra]